MIVWISEYEYLPSSYTSMQCLLGLVGGGGRGLYNFYLSDLDRQFIFSIENFAEGVKAVQTIQS